MKIREAGKVLRCQDRREAARDGEIPDGRLVWREAGADGFDPLTGFVMRERLPVVALYRHPDRFALEPLDILMVFQGGPGSIGQTGLVLDKMWAVPARSVCVLRVICCDPVALFLWLRQDEVRRELAALAKFNPKNRKAFLSLDLIRNYGFDLELVEKAAKPGEELIGEYREGRKRLAGMLERIRGIFW